MTYRTVIHQANLPTGHRERLSSLGELQQGKGYLLLHHREPLALEDLRQPLGCDINTLPLKFDPTQARLFITDLDSTLVAIETIDELAAMLNLRAQVSAITEKAMAGELDFAAALKERVALLEGLPESVLEQVFHEKMKLNPGAKETLAWLKQRGVFIAVVSGGFTFFTDRLRQALPIDDAHACQLEIKQGRLTGRLTGPIVDKHVKAEFLQQLCQKLAINPEQAVAMGDGANDIPMLAMAGMGIAYHGHGITRNHADVLIDHGDWHDVRYLLLEGLND
ncbi:MAG: hypothetical protein AXA67_06730 [Methylothermaceae bacteria B42]|nr:MAG: hypothetical protein AXA67_06730 [Methylothermaceae bacteria B42]HHJ40280.1 phosphoserine phosphatase SerB [Methylothermaceae bacterium]